MGDGKQRICRAHLERQRVGGVKREEKHAGTNHGFSAGLGLKSLLGHTELVFVANLPQ